MALPLDNVSLTGILSWCSREKQIGYGRCIHDHIIRNSMDLASAMDAYLQTSLLHMYARCGFLKDACHVFDSYHIHGNVVTWNAMIGAFEQRNLGHQVFSSFHRMHIHGIAPDRVTIDLVLSACARNAMDKEEEEEEEDDDGDDDDGGGGNEGFFDPIELGKRIHASVMRAESFMDLGVINSLINMHAKCGSLEDARTMFFHASEKKNVVTWNAMASAFAAEEEQDGCFWKGCASELVEQMQCEGVLPDNVTFINILSSYTQPSALAEGKRMHVYLRNSGFETDVIVGTSLLSMYGRCLDVVSAKRVFERMECRNTVSWNAVIGAYIHNGLAKDAIVAFAHMQGSGLLPNESTFVGILSACIMTEAASLTLGRHIHFWAVSSGCDDRHIALGSALMQMYAKCGCIEDAYRASSNRAAAAVSKDLISWNTLISSYAQHGYGTEALCAYDHMQREGTLPNKTTLVSALYACSHCGLIDEATKLLVSMSFDRRRHRRCGSIGLVLEHLHCMLDLLGRVGLLSAAQKLLYSMPFQPSPLSLMILLGACKTQHDVGRGEEFASHMFELDPEAPPAYVVLSNIYYDEKCLELAF